MATEKRKTKHKKSLWRRIKHQLLKRRMWLIPVGVVVLVAVIIVVVLIISGIRSSEDLIVSSDSSTNMGSGYRDVTWNGSRYRYNNRITVILFAGLDSDGEIVERQKYTSAPRADSIQVLVLDQKTHELYILGLSRDIMTKIRKYTLEGKDRGMLVDHLALAYAYGNGGKVSCESLCEAVSALLYDVPVRDYVVVNRSSLASLAKIIGPVEVTIPNDDLKKEDPAFAAGNTVVIDGGNLEFYTRSRDTEEDQSNFSRMERQQSYISAAMTQLLEKIADDPSKVWEDMEQMENCLLTNITRSRYLELANELKQAVYSANDYITPEGEQGTGDYYDEFYPDQEALLELVLRLFYKKQ